MKNNKEDIYNTLVPSLKDRFFQQQLNFEEENSEELPTGKKFFKYFAYASSLTVALCVFSYLAYTSYKYSAKPESVYDIPLVKKDITPIRTIPDDPGGEKFSNQDKLIYNNLMDNSVEKAETTDVDLRTPVESEKPKTEIKQKSEPKPAPIKEAIEPIKNTPVIKEEPKKIETKVKTKVAKKPKKVDNPFDILDDDVSALDANKLETD